MYRLEKTYLVSILVDSTALERSRREYRCFLATLIPPRICSSAPSYGNQNPWSSLLVHVLTRFLEKSPVAYGHVDLRAQLAKRIQETGLAPSSPRVQAALPHLAHVAETRGHLPQLPELIS